MEGVSHHEDDQAPIAGTDVIEWIRTLRQRSHRHGNAIVAQAGDLLLERQRIDEALKDIGRSEGREEKRDQRISDLENFRAFAKGAIAVLVILFPATVGVIVALLPGGHTS